MKIFKIYFGIMLMLLLTGTVMAQNSPVKPMSGGVVYSIPAFDDLGTTARRWATVYATALNLAGGMSGGDITISDATPLLTFEDTDASAGDPNATIGASATDTGDGTEDIDVTFMQQVAGSDFNFLTADADDDLTLNATDDIILDPEGLGVHIGDDGDEDYYIKFYGDTSDGTLNYDEDNADFEFDQDLASTGTLTGGTLTDGTFSVSSGAISGVTTIGLVGDMTMYDTNNDGNPQIKIGSADAEELHIQAVYDSGAQTLDYVEFITDVASVTADKGKYIFDVDGSNIVQIDDGGVEIISGNFTGNLTGDVTGNASGNAGTATALAANPDDCSANQFANAIAASGNLTCAAIADADVPNDITINLASAATALNANGANCSAGSYALGVDASGAAESCTDASLLDDGNGAAPTTDGDMKYDRTTERLQVGNGTSTEEFVPIGTLTDTKICTWDATGKEIDCNTNQAAGWTLVDTMTWSGTHESQHVDVTGGAGTKFKCEIQLYAGSATNLKMNFNNDTSSNYSYRHVKTSAIASYSGSTTIYAYESAKAFNGELYIDGTSLQVATNTYNIGSYLDSFYDGYYNGGKFMISGGLKTASATDLSSVYFDPDAHVTGTIKVYSGTR